MKVKNMLYRSGEVIHPSKRTSAAAPTIVPIEIPIVTNKHFIQLTIFFI